MLIKAGNKYQTTHPDYYGEVWFVIDESDGEVFPVSGVIRAHDGRRFIQHANWKSCGKYCICGDNTFDLIGELL